MTDPSADVADHADRFTSDLADLHIDSSSRNATFAKLGMLLMVFGAGMAIVAGFLSQATNNPLDQSTDLTFAVAGVAVGLVGLALYLRHSMAQFLRIWLLRLTIEQQRK